MNSYYLTCVLLEIVIISVRNVSNSELVSHVNCTQRFMTGCPKEGEAAYQDLNLLFLNAWCMETKMFPSRADALLSSITTFKIAILAVSYVYHRLI